MRFYEFVSRRELSTIDNIVDRLWNKLGIDVHFSKHFFDRVNDPRNKKEITTQELIDLFTKEYNQYGKTIADMNPESQAVLTDILSSINLPFVITSNNNGKQLLAKTVMRKPNYKTSNIKYQV